jgi:hypothetical protein
VLRVRRGFTGIKGSIIDHGSSDTSVLAMRAALHAAYFATAVQ